MEKFMSKMESLSLEELVALQTKLVVKGAK
jgi:hypothetical protein